MQATLEATDLIENQTLEQDAQPAVIQADERLHVLAPTELAYVGGGTGALSFF
jgi:hypothetical protein